MCFVFARHAVKTMSYASVYVTNLLQALFFEKIILLFWLLSLKLNWSKGNRTQCIHYCMQDKHSSGVKQNDIMILVIEMLK